MGVRESLPQISPMPILSEVNLSEFLSERRNLEDQPISTCIMGNRATTKLIKIFQPTTEFILHVLAQMMEMGVLQHNLTLIPGKGLMKEMLKRIRQNLREEAKNLLPFECPTPNQVLVTNIIAQNCRSALKPSFQNHVKELVNNHNPAVLIILETRIGGDRACEITNRLPLIG